MARYGLILALICIVAAGLLSGVIAQAQAEETTSLKEVLPQAESFKPIKSGGAIIYYEAFDAQGKLIGAAFKASGDGYSSTIETMVGMLKDGTITAIKVLTQNETPGLGTQVLENKFTAQFTGSKDFSGIQAITGATISSKAVMNSVKEKSEEIKKRL